MNPAADRDQPIYIVNEFASVRVRKVHTRNGERLEIAALTNGHERAIMLDALVLESLTWRSVLDLGQALRTPFGPVHGDEAASNGADASGIMPDGSGTSGAAAADSAGKNGGPA